jgi:hypothetical protein
VTVDGKMPSGLDAEGQQLYLASEKAQFVASIAQSQQAVSAAKVASLQGMLPTLPDAPTGQVTLSPNAGAFGPWRAHRLMDTLAWGVASQVRKELEKLPADGSQPRVLVVGDPAVLNGDWTARQARDTLKRLTKRVTNLSDQLDRGLVLLKAGIKTYQEAEAAVAAAAGQQQPPQTADDEQRRSAEVPPVPPAVPASTTGGPVGGATASGALGAAVDLLGLLRTDYSLAATAVTPGMAEIVTLTTARLATPPQANQQPLKILVEADVFTTVSASPSAQRLSTLLKKRDEAVAAICQLEQALAPVTAELTAISATKAILDQEWAKAVGGPDSTAHDGGQPLSDRDQAAASSARQAADALGAKEVSREQLAGPAGVLRDYAKQVVADVDAGVGALLQAPPGGQAPLYTAALRERLSVSADADVTDPGGADTVTHVLYVTADCLAADAVTRRSLFGASGILRFLAAGNASWQLMDAATGTIVAGGQESPGSVMTYNLANGKAAYAVVPPDLDKAGKRLRDPFMIVEWAVKGLVIVLALVLAALGVLAVLAVIRVALP